MSLSTFLSYLLLVLASVLLVLAIVVLYRSIRRYRGHMEVLAKALKGTTETASTPFTRIFMLQGTHLGHRYLCSFKPPVRNAPPEFTISFHGSFPEGLSIRKRIQDLKALKKPTAPEEIHTGDDTFDMLFVARERKGRSEKAFLEEQARRDHITALLITEEARMFFEGGSARAILYGLDLQEIVPEFLLESLDRLASLAR
jgi:hypothetical protein